MNLVDGRVAVRSGCPGYPKCPDIVRNVFGLRSIVYNSIVNICTYVY